MGADSVLRPVRFYSADGNHFQDADGPADVPGNKRSAAAFMWPNPQCSLQIAGRHWVGKIAGDNHGGYSCRHQRHCQPSAVDHADCSHDQLSHLSRLALPALAFCDSHLHVYWTDQLSTSSAKVDKVFWYCTGTHGHLLQIDPCTDRREQGT